ncbi:DUF4394 domain-containing protein [Aeromicrobium sp. 50.2.37]|uniref:DUF4394 domain-containing protein n=1 Tax=Aeromicrobium sp. 50.2.37 TaxID=2969305 RepID=UPI0021505597|nr:DUF4394 domain-containing protein [Aeromicrobium sp. 50.2.37]MCR4513935.1 DUF4394 domain-containing protein [Aeromicrobium sp. 50.2.37]
MRTSIKTSLSLAAAAALATGALAAMSGGAQAAPQAGDRAFVLNGAGNTLRVIPLTSPTRQATVGVISGLQEGDSKIVGIDQRPANKLIYGLGDGGGLYALNRFTAKATKVGDLKIELEGESFGVDFNPAADALRIVSNTGQNLRHPMSTQATVADKDLALSGNDFVVTGAAYTNNDDSADTSTQLFDIENAQDQLVLQVPPNDGVLVPIGKLGLAIDNDASGFDILSRTAGGRTVSNTGYAALKVDGTPSLYEIDLSTGKATRIGGLNFGASDLAVENR